MRREVAMDNFLTALGLFRKRLAKDGFCLFRAVSEQVYNTQAFYKHIFYLSRLCYQKWSTKDSYYWTELDAMQTLSRIYKIDIHVYEVSGKPPVDATKNNCQKKLVLCRIDGAHLDIVYPRPYIEELAIGQSIIYEVLYRRVFHLHDQLEEAVHLIREQNRNKFKFLTESTESSESCLDTSGSSNTSGEAETDDRIKRNRGRRVTPPVPYRIAKALDPYVYRNTELDIWEEEKREAIHRERYKFVTFSVGDKCQVVSEAGPIYHGHIQEISADRDKPVIVFIEDLGEKQSIPFDRLRPAKSVLRNDWWYKQWRRKRLQEMTITNIREMLSSVPPPPSASVPIMQHINNNGIGQSKVNVTSVPNRVFLNPPNVHPPVTPVHYHAQPQNPVTMVTNPQIAQFTTPPPPVAKQQNPVPSSNQLTVQTPYPRIWVPFMDDVALGQVDVNCPPSQDSNGKDLPSHDVNTLRFFYNLGVEYYRYISNLSCAIALQNGATGPVQPIVYCHSKPPSDRSQPESNAGNHSVLTLNKGKQKDSTKTNYDLDDKSSSASSDSGCETELGNSCHGSRTDCCHGNKASQSVKSNTNSVTNESNTIKSVVESTVKTATVELGVLQDNGLDLQSTCSDMSVSESGDGSISLPNGQEQNTVRQIRPRRKYYMYGNLKLIKPIKDVPKRFLDLLNSMSAEKHRVEGEPIILASPPSGEEHYQEMTTPYTFNPEAQCFVPGSSGTMEGATIANLECSNNASSIPTSISSNSSTANYTMYVLHQPSQSSNPTGSHGNNHPSNSTHLTNGNHSNPQYPCTPLYAGFPSNQGPAGLQMMYLPEQNSLCQQYSA